MRARKIVSWDQTANLRSNMQDFGNGIGNMIGCLFVGIIVSAIIALTFFILWLIK